MLAIAAPEFDLLGYLVFHDVREYDPGLYARRSNRSKTLDGQVSVSDQGFSHGDRTITATVKPTAAQRSALLYLVEYYTQVIVTTSDGAYRAIMQCSPQLSEAFLTFEITEKLSE